MSNQLNSFQPCRDLYEEDFSTPGIEAEVSAIAQTLGVLAQPNTDGSVPSKRF